MNNNNTLLPNRSLSDNDTRENGSVLNIENILHRQRAVSHIVSHDKEANLDGHIELVDEEGRPSGKIHVQVKTYRRRYGGAPKHPVPSYLAGYASIMKGELVMIIVSDFDGERFFWKIIDSAVIEQFKQTGARSKVLTFTDREISNKNNIKQTIRIWQTLFDAKMSEFKDQSQLSLEYIASHKYPFNAICNVFYGIPTSHLRRQETDVLFSWICETVGEEDQQVKILSGPAGCGKSVVIRDLIDMLETHKIQHFAIKADQADSIDTDQILTTLATLRSSSNKCVFVVDQLDALSRYLSNDRDKLNSILSAIATICKNWSAQEVRVIVSCREFDLHNDSRISKVLSSSPIMMGTLSDDEIKSVLESLEPDLYSKLNQSMKGLLSTPQHLDTFCRIYHHSDSPLTIKTNIELYDALWQELVHPSMNPNICADDVETVLFSISNAIINSETLNPVMRFPGKDAAVSDYLESQGIIIRLSGHIMFFHQSFYEYVYARSLEIGSTSIKDIVCKRHQGLFIRNTVKQLLDYLKGKDSGRYIKEVTELIHSEDVRKHIKTLVLDSMAFSREITFAEQDIIEELSGSDSVLFRYFLRKNWSEAWFRPLLNLLSGLFPDICEDDPIFNTSISYLSRFCELHTEDIFLCISRIRDTTTRKKAAKYLLNGNCDYKNRLVLNWYNALKPEVPLSCRINYIEYAAKSHPRFALSQTSEFIDMILESGKTGSAQDRDFHDMTLLFKKLSKNYPVRFYYLLKERVLLFSDNNRFSSYFYGLDFACFESLFWSDTGPNPIIMLISLLKEMTSDFKTKEIPDLLRLKEDFTTAAAFEIMSETPQDYNREVKAILNDNDYTSHILESTESQYWFRLLLEKWYETVDSATKKWFQEYLLKYKSPLDRCSAKNRNAFNPLVYPQMGYEQWKLIHTVAKEEMEPTLYRKMQELDRRFGGQPANAKANHGVSAALVCSRLVPKEVCMNFTEKRWEEFIINSQHYKESRSTGQWHPVDERLNMEDFTEYIKKDAEKHLSFAKRIISNPQINLKFKNAGLKGLAEGGTNPILVKRLLDTLEIPDRDSYDYFDIIDTITDIDSAVVDELIPELVRQAYRDDYTKADTAGNTREPKMVCILNHIINTSQGKAITRLIDLAHLESRRQSVYAILSDIRYKLHPELQAFVLWRLYVKDYYDELLFADLLKDYLRTPAPEFLLLNAQCIYNFFTHYPGVADDFLDSMAGIQECHDLLAQIYFLAHSNDRLQQIADEHLDSIIGLKEDDCFRSLAKMCIKNISDPDYRAYAIQILEIILKDDSKNTSAAEQLYIWCDQFSTDDFPLFQRLLKLCSPASLIHGRHILSYLEKCIPDYPRECYTILKMIDSQRGDQAFDEESFILLLLNLYSILKEKADKKTMDSIMDTFDKHIVLDNYGLRQALEEMDKC